MKNNRNLIKNLRACLLSYNTLVDKRVDVMWNSYKTEKCIMCTLALYALCCLGKIKKNIFTITTYDTFQRGGWGMQ